MIEILIATVIFALISVTVILIYQRSTVTVRQGIDESSAQQNARLGFEKLTTDLRSAGFDFDRDGDPALDLPAEWLPLTFYLAGTRVRPSGSGNDDQFIAARSGSSDTSEPQWPTGSPQNIVDGSTVWKSTQTNPFQQPDEQIEYAGPSAITFRGNFDFEITANELNGREQSYESSHFPVVTTGNDEVVTYALRSLNIPENDDSIDIFLDMNDSSSMTFRAAHPGGRAERRATIPTVDLSNSHPPYTLFRFTFDERGQVVASPIAENVRSLHFLYYEDSEGRRPLRDMAGGRRADAAAILGNGRYDPARPGEQSPERIVRARIRSVRVQLVAMTTQPDPHYRDDDLVAAARAYRKFPFDASIVPRNLGHRGQIETPVAFTVAP